MERFHFPLFRNSLRSGVKDIQSLTLCGRKPDKSPIGFKSLYQKLMERASNVEYIKNFSGYGLVDASIVAVFRKCAWYIPSWISLGSQRRGDVDLLRAYPEEKGQIQTISIRWLITGCSDCCLQQASVVLALYCGLFSSVIAFGVGLYYLLFKLVIGTLSDLGWRLR